jgi:hypothetical protein
VLVKWRTTIGARATDMRRSQHPNAGSSSRAPRPSSRRLGDEPGLYLTDDVFLYRVVAFVAEPIETVELEDCFRLDIVPVALADLLGRRLRAVAPHEG